MRSAGGLAIEARVLIVTHDLAAALADASELLAEADRRRGRSRPSDVAETLRAVRSWARQDASERVVAALDGNRTEILADPTEILAIGDGNGGTIEWMNADDTATALEVSPHRVRQLARAGLLAGERAPAWRFRPSAVAALVAARS